MTAKKSYREILHSSSIMGSANALEYLSGMLRVKVVAVLLGPSGVGLIGLYTSVTGLLGTATGLGITSSGVREVSLAYGREDPHEVARIVVTLRRACLCIGMLGWLLAIGLAKPISEWMFNSSEHIWAIAILGSILLLNSIAGGQKSVLQAQRRIGDLARMSVVSVFINTLITIALYYWLREKGIVPVMVASAISSLGVSFWFSRKVAVAPVQVSLQETVERSKNLVNLGWSFMMAALFSAGVDIAVRITITREWGIEAAGNYQAAWSLSGLFAGFVLSAMGADFYPRLTRIIDDHAAARQAVNEQTETGILLALPGLLATLAFAPLAIQIFYTKNFIGAAETLPFFTAAVFGKIVSWPLAYIVIAKGKGVLFAAIEVSTLSFQLLSSVYLIQTHGVIGAAYSFALTYAIYTIVLLKTGGALIDFRWSSGVMKLFGISILLIAIAFFVKTNILGWSGHFTLGSIVVGSVVFSALQIKRRLKLSLDSVK